MRKYIVHSTELERSRKVEKNISKVVSSYNLLVEDIGTQETRRDPICLILR